MAILGCCSSSSSSSSRISSRACCSRQVGKVVCEQTAEITGCRTGDEIGQRRVVLEDAVPGGHAVAPFCGGEAVVAIVCRGCGRWLWGVVGFLDAFCQLLGELVAEGAEGLGSHLESSLLSDVKTLHLQMGV